MIEDKDCSTCKFEYEQADPTDICTRCGNQKTRTMMTTQGHQSLITSDKESKSCETCKHYDWEYCPSLITLSCLDCLNQEKPCLPYWEPEL